MKVKQVTFRHTVDSLIVLVPSYRGHVIGFQEYHVNSVMKCVIMQSVPKIRPYQEAAEVWQMIHFGDILKFRVATMSPLSISGQKYDMLICVC